MQADTGLPANWEVRYSQTKNLPYYYNGTTHESRWEPPSECDLDKLRAYMTHFSRDGRSTTSSEDRVRVAHILIKHQESRRPSSWRETKITRSQAEAVQIAERLKSEIASGRRTLGDLAMTESDDSSASKRGDLGYFSRGQMQRPFEEAAFALQIGEVSGLVETASGIHIIER